jgi:hypothetical protein
MYVKRKMVPVETVLGMGREGDKGEWCKGWHSIVRTFVNVTCTHTQHNSNKKRDSK